MPSWRRTHKAYTRFWNATQNSDVRLLRYLVTRYPELRDYDGPNGAITHIVAWHCPEYLEALLIAGADPNAGAGGIFGTGLHAAACEGDMDRLKLLLRFGANTEARNAEGETPLGYAVGWGQREAVEVLLEAGAEINAIEDNGTDARFTALDATNDPELVSFLRSRGAKAIAELEGTS